MSLDDDLQELTEDPRPQIMTLFFEKKAITSMRYNPHVLPTTVLDEYAKHYAFERKDLSWSVTDMIEHPVWTRSVHSEPIAFLKPTAKPTKETE
jgi:hypothetical protein